MACKKCLPELVATEHSFGEHHVTIEDPGSWRFHVFKDGVEILDSYEVNVLAGTAKRYVLPPVPCSSCGEWAEAYIDHGNFSFSLS